MVGVEAGDLGLGALGSAVLGYMVQVSGICEEEHLGDEPRSGDRLGGLALKWLPTD